MTELSTLILADPDKARRAARCAALEGEDLYILEAGCGQEALALACTNKVDAALLDVDLSAPDGIGVYRQWKADAGFAAPVMLTIANRVSGDRRAAALAEKADAYLLEPDGAATPPEIFAAAIRSLMRLGRVERERTELTGRLRAAQAEIEKFAAQVCHDVEEPLRAVSTFVQLVEERTQREAASAGALNESERGYLQHVLASSSRVRYLLRGFLTYAQVGAGRRSHFARLDLRVAAAAAIHALRKRAEESRATIRMEEPWPLVWGDFAQLQQVFEHMLRNAIDYARRDSGPVITLGAKQNGEEWVVTVSDNGAGIASEFQSAVFQPFKRLHGREIPGAGMGLAISRKIVEAHGGRMWVESEPGSGASFRFSVRPIEAAEGACGSVSNG